MTDNIYAAPETAHSPAVVTHPSEFAKRDRKLVWLLYVVLVMTVLNFGVTMYFHLAKPAAESSSAGSVNEALPPITEKEANDIAREIVDQYNDSKTHELYLKFDDLAKIEFSEQKLVETVTKLHTIVGRVDDFVYVNSEFAGKRDGRTYVVLNFKVRVSGGMFPAGILKITVSRNDGKLALYGFFLNGLDGK